MQKDDGLICKVMNVAMPIEERLYQATRSILSAKIKTSDIGMGIRDIEEVNVTITEVVCTLWSLFPVHLLNATGELNDPGLMADMEQSLNSCIDNVMRLAKSYAQAYKEYKEGEEGGLN